MKKITQTKTPEDFEHITKKELYALWFGVKMFDTPLSDKQIATMYGVTKQDVRAKRKEKHLNWLSCALLYVAGGKAYK